MVLSFAVLSGTIRAQQASTVRVAGDSFHAGETFTVTVTLSEQFDSAKPVYFNFINSPVSDSFSCTGSLAVGSSAADLSCSVPLDVKGGTYVSSQLHIQPSLGYRNEVLVDLPERSISITPMAHKAAPRVSATIRINLTQQQLMRKGSAQVQGLLNDVLARLNRGTTDTTQLKKDLTEAVIQADADLLKSRNDFSSSSKNQATAIPVFFDDLDKQYRIAAVEIGVPNKRLPPHIL